MSRHIKSRSGCRVCKAKRLKCDETMPACRNCVNRGIACPGYRQVLRWSTKYENPAPKAPPARGSNASDTTATLTNETADVPEVPEFSQLASAASRSIKPGRVSNVSASPARAPKPVVFEPVVVKTETGPPRQLSQVPQVPQIPPVTVSAIQTIPVSSHAAAGSSPASSTFSYGQHSAPVVPVLDKTIPDPFSFPYPHTTAPTVSTAVTSRPAWQLAPYGDADEPDEDEEDVSFTLELWQPGRFKHGSPFFRPQPQQQQLQALHPTRGLALPGTSLVELWFKSVCGMWAALDSPSNPFRQLCSRLWSSNEAVFFSMQTMAAASLPKRPPSVREIVAVAPQMSTQALIHELQELFETAKQGGGDPNTKEHADHDTTTTATPTPNFPAGLLTSLFCMSSSLSWIDARQLGIQYLRNARSVIELLDLRAAQLSPDDRELLEFFRGCLLYEEMLRSIVTDDQEDIQALLDWSPDKTARNDSGGVDLHLHAWAGVPIVLIGLFGKVMALCRRSRKVWRTTARATYQLLYQAMQDIQEGQALEAMLLSIDIPIPGKGVESGRRSAHGDHGDLPTHIYKAAEAFRLSSLLQLYQTFPDLVSQRQQAQAQQTPVQAPGKWLMPLVLHVVDLLGQIPADSPMRCLQPLLCLCAGSALRVDDAPDALAGTSALALVDPARLLSTADPLLDFSFSGYTGLGLVGPDAASVHMARDALRVRLATLERNLPPRPITVARQLLETVWLTYDTETAPNRSHWLDIMAETNFESVFG